MEDHTCDDRPTAHDCRHAVDRSLGESPRTVGLCNARPVRIPIANAIQPVVEGEKAWLATTTNPAARATTSY
jgi:hypothetical protein